MAEEAWTNMIAEIGAGGEDDKLLCGLNQSDLDFLEQLSGQKTGEASGPSQKQQQQQSP